MKREVVVATRNKKKYEEIKRLFGASGIGTVSLEGFRDMPDVIEDGDTFAKNAAKKALAASSRTDRLVVADDSGLEVDALGGKPGVHSARYAGPGQDDRLNIARLLKALQGKAASQRTARFRCIVAIAGSGRLMETVEGICEGRIATLAEGDGGFGYDPVFIPDGYDKSFSMLGPEVKDSLSHRGEAFRKAVEFIEGYFSKAL